MANVDGRVFTSPIDMLRDNMYNRVIAGCDL
jgi:hypothetical protein